MDSLLNAIRSILGEADFYRNNIQGYSWDYSAMIEYIIGGTILLCVICNVFKLLRVLFGGK